MPFLTYNKKNNINNIEAKLKNFSLKRRAK